MSWQCCPNCDGQTASILDSHRPKYCGVCMNHGIINEETGEPPSRKWRLRELDDSLVRNILSTHDLPIPEEKK